MLIICVHECILYKGVTTNYSLLIPIILFCQKKNNKEGFCMLDVIHASGENRM